MESRNIFGHIVNHNMFSKVSFILLLNKMDLLEEKVRKKKVNIANHFPEEFSDVQEVQTYVSRFGGDPSSLEDVKNFILYLFVERQK